MGSPLGSANCDYFFFSVGCRKPKKAGNHWATGYILPRGLFVFTVSS